MPHPIHRRRRRASEQTGQWLAFGLGVGFALLGLPVLAGFLFLTPAGQTAVTVLAGAAALLAVVVIGCVAGRVAASIFNFVGRIHGRLSLEKFAREHPPHRPA